VLNKDLPHDGHGIIPDIPVPPGSWYLAHRIDPKMSRVLEMVDAKNNTAVKNTGNPARQ
jgi:hypothetical protein